MEVVGFIVVHVQSPEQLRVPANCHVFDVTDAIDDGLAGKLLHLDVVELPEVTEPLDQLRGDAAVELEMERIKKLHVTYTIYKFTPQRIKGSRPADQSENNLSG